MSARRKIVFLILGLILPFLAFAMYFVVAISRHPSKVFPVWLAYFAFFYIFGSVVLVMVVSRKLARTTSQHTAWARAFASRLIAIWSGLFFYGAYRTIKGDIPIGTLKSIFRQAGWDEPE